MVLILGFWLPCTLALQIIYPALDKAFHLEKTITARREDEINDLMEQHGHNLPFDTNQIRRQIYGK